MNSFDYWKDFLYIISAAIGLSEKQKNAFETRFSLENIDKQEREIASFLNLGTNQYKKRMTKFYASFKMIYPELGLTHKYSTVQAWLMDKYQDWFPQEFATNSGEYWDDFLMLWASRCNLSPEQSAAFSQQFAQENRNKYREEIATILDVDIEVYKKRMTEVYAKFEKNYPKLRTDFLKFKKILAFLEKEYQDWQPKERAGKSVTSLFQECKFNVKDVSSEYEIKYISRLESFESGREVFSNNILYSWWQRFPNGIKALFLSSQLVGAICLLPLELKWATKLKKGEIGESQLVPSSVTSLKNSPSSFLYIGGIVIERNVRKTKLAIALKTLLHQAAEIWIKQDYFHYPLEFLALGTSRGCINMLENATFKKIGINTIDSSPIYSCHVKNQEQLYYILSRWCDDVDGCVTKTGDDPPVKELKAKVLAQ